MENKGLLREEIEQLLGGNSDDKMSLSHSEGHKIKWPKYNMDGAAARKRIVLDTEKYLVTKINMHNQMLPPDLREMYEILFAFMETIASFEDEVFKNGE